MDKSALPDLGAMRREAGLSINDLAARLGMDPHRVEALEADPAAATGGELRRWAEATGAYGRPRALHLGEAYAGLRSDARQLSTYLRGWRGDMPTTAATLPAPDRLADEVDGAARPARVVFGGPFDVGKTTLIEVLLGMPKGALPAAFAPKTRLIVDFRSRDDRPAWLGAEVAYFREGVNADAVATDAARGFLMREDDLASLHALATHDGGEEGWAGKARGAMRAIGMLTREAPAGEEELAVVFNGADALRSAYFGDLPGAGSGYEGDERKLAKAAGMADALVYMSPLMGFLSELDLMLLPMLAEQLPRYPSMPRLANLLIVAGHADRDETEINRILDLGARRLHAHLAATGRLGLAGGAAVTEAELRARMFAFSARQPRTSEPLTLALEGLLGRLLPPVREEAVRAKVGDGLKRGEDAARKHADELRATLGQRDRAKRELDEQRGRDASRDRFVAAGRRQVAETIQREYAGARDEVDAILDRWADKTEIERLIREEFKEDEYEEARDRAMPLVVGRIQAEVGAVVERRALVAQQEISQFVRDYELTTRAGAGDGTAEHPALPAFDAKTLFQAASAGSAVLVGVGGLLLGALKSVFLGPLFLIALAVFGTWQLYRLLRTDWQTRLAGTVADRLRSAKLGAEMQRSVRALFQQAGETFDAAVAKMEAGYGDYRAKMEETLNAPDAEARLQSALAASERLADFYARAPWRR